MKHVHITLVGEQIAPVYNGILATNPNLVIFIHSDKTREHVQRIKQNLHLSSIPKEFDPSEMNDISTKVAQIRKTYADSEQISINISSGTKAWTYYFIQEFSSLSNVTFFYVDQNNKIWNLREKTNEELSFDMDRQLQLYSDQALSEYTKYEDFTTQDNEQIEKIISTGTIKNVIFLSISFAFLFISAPEISTTFSFKILFPTLVKKKSLNMSNRKYRKT